MLQPIMHGRVHAWATPSSDPMMQSPRAEKGTNILNTSKQCASPDRMEKCEARATYGRKSTSTPFNAAHSSRAAALAPPSRCTMRSQHGKSSCPPRLGPGPGSRIDIPVHIVTVQFVRPSGVGKAGPHGPRCRVTTSSSSATTIPSCYQDFKLQSFKLHPSSENSAVCHAAFAAQFITAETRPRRRSRVRQRDGLRCVRRRSGVIPALRTLTEEGSCQRLPPRYCSPMHWVAAGVGRGLEE
ncbi:hypothetical protein C8Q72DRAFT_947612 [Fomitopsis betulina]|nr:hypothetical protein C8Q72DRAFT_947612 [Fomitopsis betulina]